MLGQVNYPVDVIIQIIVAYTSGPTTLTDRIFARNPERIIQICSRFGKIIPAGESLTK